MLKTVTLDAFRDAIAAEQQPFLGLLPLPTFFGMLALTTVVIDTYLNAIGKNGFTVFSINSIFGSIHYLALFFFVIILQLILISIAFLNLRHLRFIPWKSPIIYANYLLDNRRVYLAFFITLAILISWGLSHAISVSSNLETVTSVSSGLLTIIFTSVVFAAIVIIVDSFIKILRLNPSLSVGLIFGIFICTVSYILTPNQLQVIVDLQKVRDQIISEQTATTTTDLKVRENPGSRSPELGKILKGDLVVFLGKEEKSSDGGNWTLISNNNVKGWVNKKFLSVNLPSTSAQKITDHSSERVYLSEISQFRHWQAGIFFATITSFTLFFLLIQFNQTTEETIFQLDLDKDESGTSFYEYSPIGLALNAPIYINFLAQNQLIVAFSREINSNSYRLLDVKDNQSTIPLYDRSITIWNISKVKERINQDYELSDTLDFFKIKCSTGFLSTSVLYEKNSGGLFNYSHVNFITDIIFKKSDDFKGLIESAMHSTFEEFMKPLRIDINNINTKIKQRFNLKDINTIRTSTNYIDYKLQSLEESVKIAKQQHAAINNHIELFGNIKERIGDFDSKLNDLVTNEILKKISKRINEIGFEDTFFNETRQILLMLGFCINSAGITMLDNATKTEALLNELQQESLNSEKTAADAYDEALKEKEKIEREEKARREELLMRILENPTLGQSAKIELTNNLLSGEQKIPKIAQTTSLQLGNDDIDNPT